ncbi:SHOCT domain-containing protein [Candidatus Falkowbacteria bacterium]|nr:SHOCT domain-containing protein [Candidatus Falkowbacteria bacterium]
MMGGFGPGFGFFFMIIFWALVVWAIVALVRCASGRSYWCCGRDERHGRHEHGRALDILKERYAKGEITKEQFEQTKKDLQ